MWKYKNNTISESEYFAEPQVQDFPAPEYQPLPDEYLQQEFPVKNSDRKQKRKWVRMLCMLVACVLLGYSTYQAEAVQTEEAVPIVEDAQSPNEEAESDAGAIDVTEQPAGQYPPESGTLYYKIYNETLLDQPVGEEWERILEEGEISVEQLFAGEVITLPQPEIPDGFEFLGWAAHFRGEKDTYPKWSLITENFTAEDAVRIRPDEDGNRSVDIHAVWRTQESDVMKMIMVLDANGGTVGGQASQTYNALTPKYSGGTVYLCGYPTPEREGYHFTGWYLSTDEGEKRMETLSASRFFEEKNGETDYGHPLELHLTAGWEKSFN